MHSVQIDTIVIGGGPGGIYCSKYLRENYPDKSVLTLEANDYLGGRLFSHETNDLHKNMDSVKDELGGMRIFPSTHVEVAELVQAAGMTMTPVLLEDENSLFVFGGQTVRKGDAVFTTEGKFKGQPIGAVAKQAKRAFKQKHGDMGVCHDAYANAELRKLSLREFFKKYAGCNDDEFDMLVAYGGYDLMQDSVQSSIWMHDGELYGSGISHHWFVNQGYAMLVRSMAKGSPILHNFKISRIRKDASGDFLLACENGNVFRAKQVIISLAKVDLLNITGVSALLGPNRMKAINACQAMPLFKCFMEYDTRWWKDEFAGQGKTTTTGNCRQIHYYDESDILVYNSGKFAMYWENEFKKHPKMALKKMHQEIVEIHQPFIDQPIPDPNWDKCTFKYWLSGSHKWRKGADVRRAINTITDGRSSGLYITGDAFSEQQGWVQGAFDTCKIALKAYESVNPGANKFGRKDGKGKMKSRAERADAYFSQ